MLSIVALCDTVNNGWHSEIVPEASPKGESKSNGEVERAFSICARTCEDPQRLPGATIWNHVGVSKSAVGLVGGALCQSSLLFHNGEPHDSHTAYLRLKVKLQRVELPSFGECVDHRKRTRHKLESRLSAGAFVGVFEQKQLSALLWTRLGNP